MVSLQALACALMVVGSGGETALLDFSAEWCGPCRMMQPAVQQLAAAGYPVRQVNIDHEPALAAKYGVTGVPCFVMLVNGREVDRVVGATSPERLVQMLNQAQAANPKSAAAAPTASAVATASASATKLTGIVKPKANALVPVGSVARHDIEQRLLAASVRLHITDARGNSVGSGTIIDAREGEALVLTCGHVFRDSKGKGKIVVDTFGPQARRGIPAELVTYDLERDIGLVSFRPGMTVSPAPLATADYKARPNEPVVSIGCDHGADPTVRRTRVTTIDKFQGPANLEIDGQPVQGRSGGGLFTADGRVIGVCNAADPADNEGLFAALPTIYAVLEDIGLTKVLASQSAPPPAMPATMPGGQPAAVAATGGRELTAEELAALENLQRQTGEAEVICIVRSPNEPSVQSRIIVLDRASSKLLEHLDAARQQQQSPQQQLTSLRSTQMPR
ncbi:MAG TPA: trypsin-like peptidase domain-containing protein [Pirellulales bacterium]|jgi:thiol-disulfide isomerase/thioredoxin|nr:trypsin-like peptidase domain-containing protein [Pirellulales bacterium]